MDRKEIVMNANFWFRAYLELSARAIQLSAEGRQGKAKAVHDHAREVLDHYFDLLEGLMEYASV